MIIPTAEEFLLKDSEYLQLKNKFPKLDSAIQEVMVEFAKLHVQAAIKECIESAPSGSSTDAVSYEDVVYALTDCYPLENIKQYD